MYIIINLVPIFIPHVRNTCYYKTFCMYYNYINCKSCITQKKKIIFISIENLFNGFEL